MILKQISCLAVISFVILIGFFLAIFFMSKFSGLLIFFYGNKWELGKVFFLLLQKEACAKGSDCELLCAGTN